MFRTPQGQYLLTSLFIEKSYSDRTYVLYTWNTVDHEDGYKSLHRLYMDAADPTEVYVALNYFENWEHWQRLCRTTWFKPIVEEWRYELELRIKSKALASIMEVAKGEAKNTFDAQKLLLSGAWKEKEGPAKGRPTKQRIKEEAEALFQSSQDIKADLARIQ